MQFLPIVQRELLVASRKRGTYLSRTLSAAVLLVLFAVLLDVTKRQPTITGAYILQFLSAIIFLECMLAGMRYTSDCLSEEKREGTLGLLFLTNLSGWDVVLGKMIAGSMTALFNLVAALPILALTLLVGGVMGGQITALAVTFVVTTIFSLCLGAFISSRGEKERGVLIATLAFLLVINFAPLIVRDFLFWAAGLFGRRFVTILQGWHVQEIQYLSPYYAFSNAGRGWVPQMQWGCLTLLGISGAFVAYAAWRIRSSFGEPGETKAVVSKKRVAEEMQPMRRFRSWNYSVRQRILAHNPVLWLSSRSPTRPAKVLIFGLIVLTFGLVARVALEAKWAFGPPMVLFGSYGAHAIFKMLVTAEAVRQLNEDKRSGALELLLTTPIPSELVVKAQVLATRKTWLTAGVCLAFMNLTWMTEGSFMRDVGIILPCSIVLLVFDSIALTYVALVNALKGDRYVVTVFRTFARIMLPATAAIVFIMTLKMGTPTSQSEMEATFVFWTAGCVIYDLILMARARTRLRKLRAIAAGDEHLKSVRTTRSPFPSVFAPRAATS